jgi:prepilin-type N-terminal cleavage/methylation domain-containing protein
MNTTKRNFKGFTLIEMMLVLVIASSLMVMALNFSQQKMDQLRRERTAIQMQALLNAAASYYVVNNAWPTITQLNTAGFIPSVTYKSGWGDAISVGTGTNGSTFYTAVTFAKQTVAKNTANALIVAGMLPLGTVSGTNNTTATGYVNVPGQNLNNAMAVNFGAIYFSGACVPAPTCPTGMKPTIMVVPVSATGVVGNPTCTSTTDPTTCSSVPTAALTSFTAFYRGASLTDDTPVSGTTPSTYPAPADCEVTPSGSVANHTASCEFGSNTWVTGQAYWRVCLAVATGSGISYPTSTDSNAYNEGKLTGSILAITRCQPTNGDVPAGSPNSGATTIWTHNNGWNP